MYYVYVTAECKAHAKDFGKDAEKDLDVIVRRIENTQQLGGLKNAHPYQFKERANFWRWILRVYSIEGMPHKVVVLLDVVRWDREFREVFLKGPEKYGTKRLEPLVAGLNFKAFVNAQQKKKLQHEMLKEVDKPLLSKEETHFITEPAAASHTGTGIIGDVIFESRQWTDYVRRTDRVAWLPRIRDAISDIYTSGSVGIEDGDELLFQIPEHEECAVAYQWLDGGKNLFLYDIKEGNGKTSGAIPKCRVTEPDRPFFRVYPVYMLDNEVFWMSVETDPAGNFALSDEEEVFLHAGEDGGLLQFPLFVNGRAGSGKSTVLQYLYAEYFARWVRGAIKDSRPPVYFACNAELLDRAREFVASILSKNPDYHKQESLKQYVKTDEQSKEVIRSSKFDAAFREFRMFLLGLVPETERIENFALGEYVDYARFCQLWCLRFGHEQKARQEYGPEVSWHVIRTFIKGQTSNGYVTPGEYEKLSKARRSVSNELFRTIYDRVWEDWYKKLTVTDENRKWDDQDLVRYVVSNGLIGLHEKFFGVFCDESQDFTQVELEAIFKSSIFSDRTVYPHQLSKIPFVFAGDEFQTLNPTGFKWTTITSAFTEKFIKGMRQVSGAGTGRDTGEVKRYDLKCNYRSQANIVKYCNAVQLLRNICFEDVKVTPQKEWQWIEDAVHPVSFFEEDDKALWAAAMQRDDIIFVLPCHKGEELEYIKRDKVLSQRVHVNPETGTTRPPMMSAARVKGLEHTCVAVYGFGKFMHEARLSLDMKAGSDDIPLEYFMNRLYVAVSRARRQLYIVDSIDGRKAIWDVLAGDRVKTGFLNKITDYKRVWEPHITGWEHGDSKALVPDNGSLDPIKLAQELQAIGEKERDVTMMQYAADFYKASDKCISRRTYCLAQVEVFMAEGAESLAEKDSHYRKAAELFIANIGLDDGSGERAIECLWKMVDNKAYEIIAEIVGKHADLASDDPRIAVAQALSQKTPPAIVMALACVQKAMKSAGAYAFSTVEWQRALGRTLGALSKVALVEGKSALPIVAEFVSRKVVRLSVDDAQVFGDALVDIEDYDRARTVYRAANIRGGDKFKTAMLHDVYPNYLDFCDLIEHDEVLRVMTDYARPENAARSLSQAQMMVVAWAYGRENKLHAVASLLAKINDAAFFSDLYKKYKGEARVALREACLIQSIRKLDGASAQEVLFGDAEGWGKAAEQRLPVFQVRCLSRIPNLVNGDKPVSASVVETRNMAFRRLWNGQLIHGRIPEDELIRAAGLFAEKSDQAEFNIRLGGRRVEDHRQNLIVSSWDEFLSEVLVPERLEKTVDAAELVFNNKEGYLVASATDACVDQVKLHENGIGGQEGVAQYETVLPAFARMPTMGYQSESGTERLNFMCDIWDHWYADRSGIYHNGHPVGKELKLTQHAMLRVNVEESIIEVTDSESGLSLSIHLSSSNGKC